MTMQLFQRFLQKGSFDKTYRDVRMFYISILNEPRHMALLKWHGQSNDLIVTAMATAVIATS